MSKRLNKAIQELNIGLQTAIDFLRKRNLLESENVQPTLKLSEEQFNALVVEFSSDKKEREKVDILAQKKAKDKAKNNAIAEKEAEAPAPIQKPQIKTIGKIDLDNIGIKATSKPAAKHEQGATTVKEEATVANADAEMLTTTAAEKEGKSSTGLEAKHKNSTSAPVSEPEGNIHSENKQEASTPKEEAAQPSQVAKGQATDTEQPKEGPSGESNRKEAVAGVEKQAAKEAPSADSVKGKEDAPAQDAAASEAGKDSSNSAAKGATEVFTLPREQKAAPKVNVLGKIDLSTINSSMRPKKKSKEERRKEREEKAAQNGGEKKKRARINNARVDIKTAGNQPQNNNQNASNAGGKKKKNKKPQRQLEVNEEDVARQVKETLARLTSKSQNKKGAKYRREKRDAVHERMQQANEELNAENKVLKLTEFVTVSELATMMNVGVTQVIGTCMSVGIMVSINQRLDAETINLVADEFGFTTEYISAEVQEAITETTDNEEDLVPRAPIVTVMGHVDHGKTSLLDYIRKTNVIAGEAGGITQHIGAYNVELEDGRQITFLDTPGHEAFTAMRARGAQVTDIAIIIIAADDSVMPTTKEAIAHAQAANVPMVFAINKVDKPGANPEKIREDLANMNLLVEDWGGKYQCQEISAKKGMGINELLEKVLLEAEMLELKANPNRKATGSIIESSLDKGRGYVSTVLVSNGTLHVGDVVVAGTSYGRVKAMFNERNQRIAEALPSEPCIILGLNGAPTAGDTFHIMDTEQEAREIANKRTQLQREQALRTTKTLGLDELSHRFALGEFHELNIIVKGDTDGSIEALADSFIKLSTEKVQVNVISKAVGQISENDVMLASASDAIIVGFQVRPSAEARKTAEREGVSINIYSIIYDAIDDIKSTMEGMLDKVKKEVVTGEIEVKQVFKISKVGTVAGGLVTEGKVHNKDKARVIRDGIVVHTANIGALKRYKDDAKEVATGLECGVSLQNYNDIQVGDIIETFTEIEVEQKL